MRHFRLPHLHRSSVVVALLTAIVMTLVVAPGSIGHSYDVPTLPCGLSTAPCTVVDPSQRFVHGWPAPYVKRTVYWWPPRSPLDEESPEWLEDYPIRPIAQVPWLSWNAWKPWQVTDYWEFSAANLAFDLTVAMAIVTSTTTAWEWRRRRRKRLLQISVTDLIATTTAIVLLAGWLSFHRSRFARELAIEQRLDAIESDGDDVVLDVFLGKTCLAPNWLQRLAGPQLIPEYLHGYTVAYLQVYASKRTSGEAFESGASDEKFSQLAELSRLRTIEFENSAGEQLTHRGATLLARLKHLRTLIFTYADEVSPELRRVLASELPNCEIRCYWDETT